MTFSFDINLEEYDICDNSEFKNLIFEAAKEEMVLRLFDYEKQEVGSSEMKACVKKFCKDHEQEIFEAVTNRIVDKIEKKKAIKDLTPSAREIQSINKENEKYFIELIDKAIAKRFK